MTTEGLDTTNKTLTQAMHLSSAKLWSLETPNLYILRTQLLTGTTPADTVLDEVNVTFGVRRAVFDVRRRLFVPAQPLLATSAEVSPACYHCIKHHLS